MKLLILCVDRDNDLGEKIDIHGPIIGRSENLKTAMKFGLKDPEDSDFNTIFDAIKTYDELKEQGKDVEIATITGDKNVGIKSDEIISEQLETILLKTKSEKVVLISDGAEDEHIIPIINSMIPILSVKRVIIKQNEKLEGTYYMIIDFLKQIFTNQKLSKLILGVPAVMLMLYALLGISGWRIMLGAIAIYLFIKAFRLEEYIYSILNEMHRALTEGKISFFLYIVAITVILIGIANGYNSIRIMPTTNFIDTIAMFLKSSIFIFYASFLLSLVGKLLCIEKNRKKIVRISTFGTLGFSISFVLYATCELLLKPEIGLSFFIFSVAFGAFLMTSILIFEKKI